MALGVGLATFGSWQIYIDDVGSGSDSDLSRCLRHDRFTPGSGHAGLDK